MKTREYWSRLRISDIRVLDSGYYRCLATNSAGSVETTAVLKVKPGVKRRKGDPPIDSTNRRLSPDSEGIAGRESEGRSNWLNGRPHPDGAELPDLVAGTCQEYQGEACEEFLNGQRVLITTSNIEEIRDNGKNEISTIISQCI